MAVSSCMTKLYATDAAVSIAAPRDGGCVGLTPACQGGESAVQRALAAGLKFRPLAASRFLLGRVEEDERSGASAD